MKAGLSALQKKKQQINSEAELCQKSLFLWAVLADKVNEVSKLFCGSIYVFPDWKKCIFL